MTVTTKTWFDPCPRCGGVVQEFKVDYRHMRSNPEAVISIGNPDCRHHPADTDGPDCTCTAIVNPAPDPDLDTLITVGATFTMHPCGDVIHAGVARGRLLGEMAEWKRHEQEIPVSEDGEDVEELDELDWWDGQ